MKKESIIVIVRIRPPQTPSSSLSCTVNSETTLTLSQPHPPSHTHAQPSPSQSQSQSLNSTINTTANDLSFTYNHILPTHATQTDTFAQVRNTIQGVCEGINGCVLAYGQTAAGKTHTMLGSGDEGGGDGVVYQAVDLMFGILNRRTNANANANANANNNSSNAEEESGDQDNENENEGENYYTVHCSYLQIYNENIYDLLASNSNSSNLKIRETPHPKSSKRSTSLRANNFSAKNVFVSGLSEYRVSSTQEVKNLLILGTKNRVTRETSMNDKSSRSHAVLQISLEVVESKNGIKVVKKGGLKLVDLAGSEKINVYTDDPKHSFNQKNNKEVTKINLSLSALGNVINALTSKAAHPHIPYRNSKLTRLLQDSIGGNTRTVIICCISPESEYHDESRNTLLFGSRASNVHVSAKVNEVVDEKVLLREAQGEIVRLRILLKTYVDNNGGGEDIVSENGRLIEENRLLKGENKRLKNAKVTTPAAAAVKKVLSQVEYEQTNLDRIRSERIELERQLNEIEVDEEDDDDDDYEAVESMNNEESLNRGISTSPITTPTKTLLTNSQLPISQFPISITSTLPTKPLLTTSEFVEIILSPQPPPKRALSPTPTTLISQFNKTKINTANTSLSTSDSQAQAQAQAQAHNKQSHVTTMRNLRTKMPEIKVRSPILSPASLGHNHHGGIRIAFSLADLGLRIAIHSYRLNAFYPCTIVSFDYRRGMHCCLYDDDGSRLWHDLKQKKIERIAGEDPASPRGGDAMRESKSAPLNGKGGEKVGRGGRKKKTKEQLENESILRSLLT